MAIVSIALLMPPAASAQDQPPGVVAPDARERSRAAFKRGVAQLKANDYQGARASFELAYSLFPHPSILLNLGVARLKKGDPVLAEQDLVKFLSDDAGSPPEELAAARDALAEARGQIGTMRVQVTPISARVAVDKKPVEIVRREAAGDLVAEARVKAGAHAISVEADGYVPQSRDVSVLARRDIDVKITLERKEGAAPTPSGEHSDTRTFIGYSLAGLAVVGAIAGGVCAFRAKSLADDYKTQGSGGFQDHSTRTQGITFRTAADVSFGVALLSAAAAIVLLFTDVGTGSVSTSARQESRAGVLRW